MALESKKGVHEFGFPVKKINRSADCSERRSKVDMKGKNTNEKGMKYCIGSECETKFDLRKSLAWDSAFFTSPGFLEPEELFHYNWDNPINGSEMRTKATEFNSRMSLAWDNAFLTCEGVLNAQELCLVNKGLKRSEMHTLSAIKELSISSHSNATTDTDGSSSSLATLELQLFEDPNPSIIHALPNQSALKKMDGLTQLKKMPNSRNQTANQSQKIAKDAPTPLSSKQCCAGSGEFNPLSSSSSLKPPKSSGRVKSAHIAPTKRASLLVNEVKGNSKIVHATNGESLMVSSKTISPIKSSESKSDSHNSSSVKKKCPSISHSLPKSAARRDHRSHDSMMTSPKGTSSAAARNSVPFHASRNLKPSGLKFPSPKIGYFDEAETESEESGGKNVISSRSRTLKDKDIIRSSKVNSQKTRETTLGFSHCEHKTEDCIRIHKMVTETQAKGKRPILQREYKAFQNRPQVISTVGINDDVVIELCTKRDGTGPEYSPMGLFMGQDEVQ